MYRMAARNGSALIASSVSNHLRMEDLREAFDTA